MRIISIVTVLALTALPGLPAHAYDWYILIPGTNTNEPRAYASANYNAYVANIISIEEFRADPMTIAKQNLGLALTHRANAGSGLARALGEDEINKLLDSRFVSPHLPLALPNRPRISWYGDGFIEPLHHLEL